MTLPTTSPLNGNDDDSDMFGPPRTTLVGYHQRSRVPMISPKLRQREERKRILQLCAHKLERIKDSEANLRRSVCINNTYSRLTDEVRREKQSRYLANLPKSETKPETAHDNIYSPYNHTYADQMELRNESYHKINHHSHHHHNMHESFNNNSLHNNTSNHKHKYSPITNSSLTTQPTASTHNSTSLLSSSMGCGGGGIDTGGTIYSSTNSPTDLRNQSIYSSPTSLALSHTTSSCNQMSTTSLTSSSLAISTSVACSSSTALSTSSTTTASSPTSCILSSSSVDTDLEILDRELSAFHASMPLIDPEITQGAEQLEKAVSSRKRSRTEEENDRLVREALSQFDLPTQRVISAIEDFPPDIKRSKLSSHCIGGGLGSLGSSGTDLDLDLALDLGTHHYHHHHHHHHHHSQKDFEVIMDALRLSTSSPTPSAQDSCGQAAMMSESGVFHNLVVTSLET